VILTTDRLRLRGAEPSDLDALHAVYSDPAAMAYWSSAPDPTREATLRRIAHQFDQDPVTYFVIERDGRAIGNAGHVGRGEIGYILHPDHHGQGLAREALRRLIPYLFEVLDVPALKAEIDPDNRASVVVLSKLGFRVTGFSRDYYLLEGQPCDSVYMRLPRPGALSP
jgi:ribosomal-protein-alanine N-acetyltransferase